MVNKYYTTTVNPTITPFLQHTAFSDGDILFDWTAFQIPRGSGKLLSATAIIQPKGDAGATANVFPLELWFADDDRTTMGTVNAALADKPNRDIIGCLEMSAAGFGGHTMGANSSVSVCISGPAVDENHGNQDPIVLTPKVGLDAHNAAYHTLYIGGIAKGAFDFTTINRINETDAADQSVVTMDGSVMDCTEHFAIGDTLVATDGSDTANDITLGEVSAVASTQLTFTAATTQAFDEDDFVYVTSPIKIILAFEY